VGNSESQILLITQISQMKKVGFHAPLWMTKRRRRKYSYRGFWACKMLW